MEQVIVVEYDPNWIELFQIEKEKITTVLDKYIVSIEHIGSTAIPGLASKPIIDILIGLHSLDNAKHCIAAIENFDYQYIPEHESILPDRRFFRKPPRGQTKRTHHIHMVEIGCYFWKRQLLFRDYLREHPEALEAYAKLKYELAKKFKDNRQAYVDGKEEFIFSILSKAE